MQLQPIMTTEMAAREHVAWCVGRGMTPREVCESVCVFFTNPSWQTAEKVIQMRYEQMLDGVKPLPIITERRVS